MSRGARFIAIAFGAVIAGLSLFMLGIQQQRDALPKPPAQTICEDGTRSDSAGPGTCSHHGGVKAVF